MAYYKQLSTRNWLARVSWRDKTDLDDSGKPKKKQKAKQGFKTKLEAKRWATEYEDKAIKGLISQTQVPTFADYFIDWAKAYRIPKITPKTQEHYYNLHHHIKRQFGTLRLDQIKRIDFQRKANEFASNHARGTVRHYMGFIKACVQSAVADGIITKDFTQGVSVRGNKDKELKVEYPTVSQIKDIVNHAVKKKDPSHTEYYMIITAIYTGMRLEEIAGLTWDKIDFKNHTITISQAYDYKQSKGTRLKRLKNESSYRTIRINQFVLDIIAELKENNTKFIFANNNSVPRSPYVNKILRKILEDLNITLNDFHFHSLRHAHVALLHHFYKEHNLPVDWYAISQRLGHSNLGTTLKVYAYLADEDKQESDNLFETYLEDFTKSNATKNATKQK
ncbi:site-specific integrase [Lactobacillus sp. PV037]|uniref:tyrosine-type recombinase/integrase n=1 Tax=Lactobacillus sp. PV037 TaxID=2594496 RepID=UPI0022405CFF|nr:site-specific integrase [Lactobacillus sp. PV037]QNQ83816.1 site-specific integrase [Lactobacillus sp. PV037]